MLRHPSPWQLARARASVIQSDVEDIQWYSTVLSRVYPYEPAAMVSDGGRGGRGGVRAVATAWARRQGEGVGMVVVLEDDAGVVRRGSGGGGQS
jgi:hypothetical protein